MTTTADGLKRTNDGKLHVTIESGSSIANPTFTGTITGAPMFLTKGGVPLVSLSSGSVSAAGAISGIAALPAAYPHAYCYFPANILATTIAAGWYYCTFSTTTAGTAFLNTYTSGTPTVPASPTAVTDGKGAFTGDTTEEFAHSLSVPAFSTASVIRLLTDFEQTNSANAKTFRVRLSGTTGTIFISAALSGVATAGFVTAISNQGATGKQVSQGMGSRGVNPTVGVQGSIDTAVATTLVLSIQKATATENVVILPPIVEALL